MEWGTIIILAILAVIIFFAVRSSMKHYKGDGGCCGGGSGTIRDDKKLDAPKIGEKIAHVEGMHCENCRNAVERAVNKIDGAACVVHLKKKIAVVSYSREIEDAEIKNAIESRGYTVTEIEKNSR